MNACGIATLYVHTENGVRALKEYRSRTMSTMSILIVTGIEGAANCAAAVQQQLGVEVATAEGRKTALALLRKKEFCVVVVDDTLALCDPAAVEAIWEQSGLAVPLQVNFALSGAARLVREIRAALRRREREQAIAHRAAAMAIERELRTTITGLLLHSHMALSAGEVSAQVAEKLRMVENLASSLRQQLNAPAQTATRSAA
jgi:hypothetical protein